MIKQQLTACWPERVEVLREVFDLADKGWGLDRIAGELNKRGVDTWGQGQQKGAFWCGIDFSVRSANSRAPIGFFTPSKTTRDEVTGTRRDVALDPVALWPAAIDEEVFIGASCDAFQLTAPRGKNAMRKASSLSWRGIAKCACGSRGASRFQRPATVTRLSPLLQGAREGERL